MSKNQKHLFTLAYLAALTAMQILLSRFLSVSLWNVKFGFQFIPVVLAAISVGPWAGALVGGVGDLVGALLFPIGPYFPGFTLSAVITGLIFGFILQKRHNFTAILIAVLADTVITTLILNTVWVSVLYGSPLLPLLAPRAVQAAAMAVVQVIAIPALIIPIYGKMRLFAPGMFQNQYRNTKN